MGCWNGKFVVVLAMLAAWAVAAFAQSSPRTVPNLFDLPPPPVIQRPPPPVVEAEPPVGAWIPMAFGLGFLVVVAVGFLAVSAGKIRARRVRSEIRPAPLKTRSDRRKAARWALAVIAVASLIYAMERCNSLADFPLWYAKAFLGLVLFALPLAFGEAMRKEFGRRFDPATANWIAGFSGVLAYAVLLAVIALAGHVYRQAVDTDPVHTVDRPYSRPWER
jgi:hypothetical protein